MKKLKITASILFLSIFFTNTSLAFDIDKAANIVGSISGKSDDSKSANPIAKLENKAMEKVDGLVAKIDGKIDKVTSRIDEKISKYEEKFDEYEKKIDEVEKTTQKLIEIYNKIDPNDLQKYVQILKMATIAIGIFFALLIILLILVFIQLTRVNKKLASKS